MTIQKTKPRVGDTCWFVEWCVKVGMVDESDPSMGHDPDSDVNRSRRVETRAEAVALAREKYGIAKTTTGFVEFWPAEFVAYDEADAAAYPHAGFWEATADAECFDGE